MLIVFLLIYLKTHWLEIFGKISDKILFFRLVSMKISKMCLKLLQTYCSKFNFFNLTFQVITVMVWTACILYSAPKFYWGNTVTVSSVSTPKSNETVCVLNRQKYNSKLFDIVHFVLLYLIPLTIITVSICVVLK